MGEICSFIIAYSFIYNVNVRVNVSKVVSQQRFLGNKMANKAVLHQPWFSSLTDLYKVLKSSLYKCKACGESDKCTSLEIF